MARDDFIILVSCLVCELYATVTRDIRMRQRGSSSRLTDEEVITIEICGEHFGFDGDRAPFAYFRQHYGDFRTQEGHQTTSLSSFQQKARHRLRPG